MAEDTDKLTFGELEVGDKFVGFPLAGDNSGHGGYKGTHRVYIKIKTKSKITGTHLAKNVKYGTKADCPDSMYVIKIE